MCCGQAGVPLRGPAPPGRHMAQRLTHLLLGKKMGTQHTVSANKVMKEGKCWCKQMMHINL